MMMMMMVMTVRLFVQKYPEVSTGKRCGGSMLPLENAVITAAAPRRPLRGLVKNTKSGFLPTPPTRARSHARPVAPGSSMSCVWGGETEGVKPGGGPEPQRFGRSTNQYSPQKALPRRAGGAETLPLRLPDLCSPYAPAEKVSPCFPELDFPTFLFKSCFISLKLCWRPQFVSRFWFWLSETSSRFWTRCLWSFRLPDIFSNNLLLLLFSKTLALLSPCY